MRATRLLPASLIATFELLDQALADVLAGDLDYHRASAAAAVARAIVSVVQAGELEERVRKLEGRDDVA